MKKIPLLFTFDDGYAAQAAVAFLTMLEHRVNKVFYDIFIVTDSLNVKNQERLKKIVLGYENTDINIIDGSMMINLPTLDNEGKMIGDSLMTKSSLYRLLPTMIKELDQYDKIIYSDVDVIIKQDMSNLYDIELDKELVAGVKHPKYLEPLLNHIEEKIKEKYIFSGLLVMNLKLMRKTRYVDDVLEVMHDRKKIIKFCDQDVLNYVCNTNVKYLSLQYISIPALYDREFMFQIQKKEEYYSYEQLEQSVVDPYIVHYVGVKPWVKKKTMPNTYEEWFYWLKKTPYQYDYKELIDYIEEYEKNKYVYKVYLFGFILIGKIKINGSIDRKIKIKLLKMPIIKLKK